jgi:hypothetical protein
MHLLTTLVLADTLWETLPALKRANEMHIAFMNERYLLPRARQEKELALACRGDKQTDQAVLCIGIQAYRQIRRHTRLK